MQKQRSSGRDMCTNMIAKFLEPKPLSGEPRLDRIVIAHSATMD